MTPLFKNYEQVQRSQSGLSGKGDRGRRSLFECPFEEFKVGQNVRFLDIIRCARGESVIQRVIDATIVARFRFDLFFHRHPVVVDLLQHANGIIRRKARFARHDVGLQAGFLLVNAVFDKRTFGAMHDKLRIVNFHQMAGFDDGL